MKKVIRHVCSMNILLLCLALSVSKLPLLKHVPYGGFPWVLRETTNANIRAFKNALISSMSFLCNLSEINSVLILIRYPNLKKHRQEIMYFLYCPAYDSDTCHVTWLYAHPS